MVTSHVCVKRRFVVTAEFLRTPISGITALSAGEVTGEVDHRTPLEREMIALMIDLRKESMKIIRVLREATTRIGMETAKAEVKVPPRREMIPVTGEVAMISPLIMTGEDNRGIPLALEDTKRKM